MINLPKVLDFVKLLNKFRQVERVVKVPNQERWENDVEHSYQLALLAWYLVDSNKLNLDKNLILKYALIHDFVEVYAGDTYIYSKNPLDHSTKKNRETKATERLKKEFLEFGDFHTLIDRYEKREDKESKFIYALDKVYPILNIYVDNGRTWKLKEITLQMLIDHKKDKVALSPEIEPYFKELIELLSKEEAKLFG